MNETEGWWFPLNARKAHYMRNSLSLCKKWMTLGKPIYTKDYGPSPDDCVACRRVLDREKTA